MPSVPNRCHLPPSVGHGTQTMRRFYYDWTTDGCHQLHYTGLGGNENSFMTYEQCEDACRGGPTVPAHTSRLTVHSRRRQRLNRPRRAYISIRLTKIDRGFERAITSAVATMNRPAGRRNFCKFSDLMLLFIFLKLYSKNRTPSLRNKGTSR